jgi:hypothetical protein
MRFSLLPLLLVLPACHFTSLTAEVHGSGFGGHQGFQCSGFGGPQPWAVGSALSVDVHAWLAGGPLPGASALTPSDLKVTSDDSSTWAVDAPVNAVFVTHALKQGTTLVRFTAGNGDPGGITLTAWAATSATFLDTDGLTTLQSVTVATDSDVVLGVNVNDLCVAGGAVTANGLTATWHDEYGGGGQSPGASLQLQAGSDATEATASVKVGAAEGSLAVHVKPSSAATVVTATLRDASLSSVSVDLGAFAGAEALRGALFHVENLTPAIADLQDDTGHPADPVDTRRQIVTLFPKSPTGSGTATGSIRVSVAGSLVAPVTVQYSFRY